MKDTKKFVKAMENLNICLEQRQIDQFMLYYDLLIEWNKVMNLTTITEYDEVLQKHFIDSLSLNKVADLKSNKKILDVGTGAGFPGIPLKIAFPNLNVVLIDSLNKRVKFLNEVIDKLELEGIVALHGRAEDFANNLDFRQSFDICVSRAVANLSTLSEYCIPYVKVGGYFISYKTDKVVEELKSSENAIDILGADLFKVENFTLPNSNIQRSLVVIHKTRETPEKYPRSAGKPAKNPLK